MCYQNDGIWGKRLNLFCFVKVPELNCYTLLVRYSDCVRADGELSPVALPPILKGEQASEGLWFGAVQL